MIILKNYHMKKVKFKVLTCMSKDLINRIPTPTKEYWPVFFSVQFWCRG